MDCLIMAAPFWNDELSQRSQTVTSLRHSLHDPFINLQVCSQYQYAYCAIEIIPQHLTFYHHDCCSAISLNLLSSLVLITEMVFALHTTFSKSKLYVFPTSRMFEQDCRFQDTVSTTLTQASLFCQWLSWTYKDYSRGRLIQSQVCTEAANMKILHTYNN